MDDNVLGRISQRLEYLGGVVLLDQSACRADNGTLTAAHAGNFAQILIERAADRGIKAAVVRADDADELLFTSGYAAAAKDTLVVVADKVQGGVVFFIMGLGAGVFVFIYAVFQTQLLQLAVVAAGAGQTLFVVVTEQQLEGGLAILTNLSCLKTRSRRFSARLLALIPWNGVPRVLVVTTSHSMM